MSVRCSTDHRVRDVHKLQLRVRADLCFRYEVVGGEPCYVVEDRLRGSFFRIGVAEHAFLTQLRAGSSVADAVAALATADAGECLSLAEALAFVRWLLDNELASSDAAAHFAKHLPARRQASVDRPWHERLTAYRLALVFPDPMLAQLAPWLGWWFGRSGLLIWLCVVGSGLFVVLGNPLSFWQTGRTLFVPDAWLWFACGWLLLKSIHEFCHGLACKLRGGFVREAGVNFVLFMPFAYVDVTSAWRMPSKWDRMLVAAAGIYGELFVAGVAAWIWHIAPPGIVQATACHMVLLGSLVTLAFNANPLLRLDGYFLLTDGLEIPNLYARGQQAVQGHVRRFLLGRKLAAQADPEPRHFWILAYGWLSLVCRWLVAASLIVGASLVWHGAGLVIAVWGVLAWWIAPARRFVAETARTCRAQRISWLHPLGRLAFVGLGAVGAVVWLALPHRPRAEGYVEFAPLTVVRTPTAGIVAEVLVDSDDCVEAGTPLLRLDSDAVALRIQELEVALADAELRERIARAGEQWSTVKAQGEIRRQLANELARKKQQRDELLLVAGHGGRVLSSRLGDLEGLPVSEGQELLLLGADRCKEVRCLITQSDLDHVSTNPGCRVSLWLDDGRYLADCGRLVSILPQASPELPHPGLAANLGGRLAVQAAPSSGQHPEQPTQPTAATQLVETRFLVIIQLDPDVAERLLAGQTARVAFPTTTTSLGAWVWRRWESWYRARLRGAS